MAVLLYKYKFRPEHVKFLRNYMGVDQEVFGSILHTSSKAVRKWENTTKVVDMTWHAEKDMRLAAFCAFAQNTTSLREDYALMTSMFFKLFKNLTMKREEKKEDINPDIIVPYIPMVFKV